MLNTELSSPPGALTTEIVNNVLVVTLDVPVRTRNTLRPRLVGEFESMLGRVESDPSIAGVVLISGKSESFIVGADIDQFLEFRAAVDAERMARLGQQLLTRLEKLRAP